MALCQSQPVTTIAVRPRAMETRRARLGGSRRRRRVAIASSDPTSISAMRVSVPKYARSIEVRAYQPLLIAENAASATKTAASSTDPLACGSSTAQRQDADDQQRQDHVELLLDGEAPEVLQRRRREEVRAVGAVLGDEVPVDDLCERERHVAAQRRAAGRCSRCPPTPSAGRRRCVIHEAGSRRRKRRRQNRRRSTPSSEEFHSRSSSEVIRKPDSVKKVDTPRKPPGIQVKRAW